MGNWGKAQERPFLRSVDGLLGVLAADGGAGPAQTVAAHRLLTQGLTVLFELAEAESLEDDAENALQGLDERDRSQEPALRRWLAGVVREHALDYNDHHELDDGDWYRIDPVEHPVWALLEVNAFGRRLRLLQAATRSSAVSLGQALGVGPHQIGHWGAGRSRPGPRERDALAAAFGIHPGWLAEQRDEVTDTELYRFRACPCGGGSSFTRSGLQDAPEGCYDSAAEQAGAVRWCDACGQAWLLDNAGWLLPLLRGEDENAVETARARTVHARDAALEAPWPGVLWHPGTGRGPLRIPDLLTRAPAGPSATSVPAQPPLGAPRAAHGSAPDADWCPTCQKGLGGPQSPAGGQWVLAHRSSPGRSLSLWSYPDQHAALHAAAHMAMLGLREDRIARDLFADGAHHQVMQRFLEVHPNTDLFQVQPLVAMRADEF